MLLLFIIYHFVTQYQDDDTSVPNSPIILIWSGAAPIIRIWNGTAAESSGSGTEQQLKVQAQERSSSLKFRLWNGAEAESSGAETEQQQKVQALERSSMSIATATGVEAVYRINCCNGSMQH